MFNFNFQIFSCIQSGRLSQSPFLPCDLAHLLLRLVPSFWWQVQQSGKGTVVGVAHVRYKYLFGGTYHPYRAVIGSRQLTIMIIGYSEFDKYDQTRVFSFLVETASHFSSMTALQSTGKFRIRYSCLIYMYTVCYNASYLPFSCLLLIFLLARGLPGKINN